MTALADAKARKHDAEQPATSGVITASHKSAASPTGPTTLRGLIAAPKAKEAPVVDNPALAAALARVKGRLPIPAALQKLNAIVRDPRHTLADVSTAVESDPVLAMRVLRLANSAALGRKRPCASIRHGVALLGIRKVTSLAAAAGLLNAAGGTPDHKAVLRHSLAVANIARVLTVFCGLSNEETFSCGLLHDIGRLLLLETEGPAYREIVQAFPGDEDEAIEKERELLGFDHGAFASHVLRAWELPEPIPQVVALVHQPEDAKHEGGNVAVLVTVLRLAKVLARECARDAGADLELESRLAAEPALAELGISAADVRQMWSDVRRAYDDGVKAGDAGDISGGGEEAKEEEAAPVETQPPATAPIQRAESRRSRDAIVAVVVALVVAAAVYFFEST